MTESIVNQERMEPDHTGVGLRRVKQEAISSHSHGQPEGSGSPKGSGCWWSIVYLRWHRRDGSQVSVPDQERQSRAFCVRTWEKASTLGPNV